jgi:hypothetical protein
MATNQGTELSLESGAIEAYLKITGMRDEEAAQTLDASMRGLEVEFRKGFVLRGLILLEFEERRLWRFVRDQETGEPYPSMDKWLKRAAPMSFGDCYQAMKALKQLRDIPINALSAMPRCNIELLRLLSVNDRATELDTADGKPISIVAAAQNMRKKEFEAAIRRKIRSDPSESRRQRLVGPALNFRGILHEPIGEQGVVFLFGMVAKELGFIVESVATGFPDCLAKRRVAKDRYKSVAIEFEFQSRNFDIHGHDPKGCEVIVCWEHNWPECPLEVIELKTRLKELPTAL